jgi:phosphate transport system substrate-binding protein
VESLPLETIRDIYSGKITTWRQAGVTLPDPTSPIHAYQREPDSGSQGLMVSMVMKDTPVIDAPDMIVKTMVGPFNAIGGDPQTGEGGDKLGFGFSVYFYAAVMFDNAHVKIIGVDGVQPTPATISRRVYPLADEAYAVTIKGAAADSPGRRYVEWLLSAAGQRAVGLSGYIPLAGE